MTLPKLLPPLRMLLVWDNLAGHLTPDMVLWLIAQGIMPLYTPLGGSWLNMAESVQRIIVRRALDGQAPETPQQIIEALEATAKGWNHDPTPFVWGGQRAARRQRSHQRRLPLWAAGTRRLGRLHPPARTTACQLAQEMAQVQPNDPLVDGGANGAHQRLHIAYAVGASAVAVGGIALHVRVVIGHHWAVKAHFLP